MEEPSTETLQKNKVKASFMVYSLSVDGLLGLIAETIKELFSLTDPSHSITADAES